MTTPAPWTVPPGLQISDGSGGAQKPLVVIGTPAVGDTLVYDGDQFVPAPSGGGSGVQYVDVTFTNAQIKGIPSTPPTVLAAPAAGEVYLVRGGLWSLHLEAVYVNPNSGSPSQLAVGYENMVGSHFRTANYLLPAGWLEGHASGDFVGGIGSWPLDPDAGSGGFLASSPLVLANIAGKKLVLYDDDADGGSDYTGGHANNRLRLRVFYDVVPASFFAA